MINIYYLNNVIDAFLISFFRFPDNPVAGYFFGSAVLSFLCIVAGELSLYIAFQFNTLKINQINHDIQRLQDLSFYALKAGSKKAYKACNYLANDNYGKSFFMQITLAAASLWPLLLALGWMQYRFADVRFNMLLSLSDTEFTVGYVATFAVCYVMVRLVFFKVKHSFFSRSV
jgi:hypothetical protein